MRVLVIEDEVRLAETIADVIEEAGNTVDIQNNGEDGYYDAVSDIYDAIVLDVMLPGMDGFEILSKLREEGLSTPVLMLTAKTELEDRVNGLNLGADYYLTKPFVMVELLARIRSLTRRSGAYTPKKLSFGSVTLDISGQELISENSVRLAGMEANLMEFFMMNPNKQFTTEEIYSHVWKDGDESSEVVWIYISYLRNKLKSIAADVEIKGEKGGTFSLERLSNV